MNIKLKAFSKALGSVALCLFGGWGIAVIIDMISIELFPYILIGIGISFLVYCLYGIYLSQFQYQETLKNMVDKK